MSPAARELLALMAAEDYHAERDDRGYYHLVKRQPFMEGSANEFSNAVYELAESGLVTAAANGSGNCWISKEARAALGSAPKIACPACSDSGVVPSGDAEFPMKECVCRGSGFSDAFLKGLLKRCSACDGSGYAVGNAPKGRSPSYADDPANPGIKKGNTGPMP